MFNSINTLHAQQQLNPLMALDKLIADSEALDQKKHDYTGAMSSFHFDGDGRIYQEDTAQNPFFAPARSQSLGLTDWALGQILGRLSPVLFPGSTKTISKDTFATLKTQFPGAFSTAMNALLEKSNGRGLLVRGFENSARAVLTTSYACVSNTDLLKTLHAVLSPEVN